MQIYHLLNLFFTTGLCIAILTFLGRYESSDPKYGAFGRMLLGILGWAFFEHSIMYLAKDVPYKTVFVFYRCFSFMLLFFQPAAMEMILTFSQNVSRRDRLLIYLPFVGFYLIAIFFPQWVNMPIVRIAEGSAISLAPWNLSFRVYSLLVCGILLTRLGRKARKNKDPMAAKEQMTVFYGGTVALAAVLIIQLTFILFGLNPPLTAHIGTSLICLATFWALKRYSRAFTPAALHRSTIALTPSGMIHLCGDKIRWANPSMCKLLGLNKASALNNKPIDKYIDGQSLDSEPVARFVQRLNRGKVQDQELTLTGRNIKPVVCLVTSGAINPADPDLGSLVVFTDISERKQTEEALKESEQKYRTLVERANEGIVIIQDEKYAFVNQAMAKMLNYSVEELTGRHHLCIFPARKARTVAKRHKQRMDGIAGHASFETIMCQRQGTEIEVEGHGGLITYKGRPANLVFMRDISARKKTAREKEKMETLLRRAQKMEAIGTLAGGVAHDLNNVLSGIVSYPELLLMKLPQDSPLRKYIITIQNSGEKAASIVQDLLTLARRGVAINTVVNLNNIILDYLKSPEHQKLMSYHPDVFIDYDLDPALFNIVGSPVHLSKTIMNLVSNAAESMPQGGRISIQTHTCYLDSPVAAYETVAAGEYVTVIISDQGVGMSPEERERIFEPFYTKKKLGRSGTGLGMAVVWGCIKDHKGYIEISNNGNKGTLITLYFPVTRADLKESETEFSIDAHRGDGQQVVVVDDRADQREIAEEILTRLGYRVTTLESGEDAVAYFETHTADLLILDMIMDPGMDGLETFQKVRKLNPNQKTIIASGYSETERVRMAQESGAGAYIEKPYTIETIAAAIKKELDRSL